MKEFQSTTGGRHVYNTDFKNLQELALAMQEIFRSCGGNFVISGCEATVDDTISVSDGYAYIDGRIRKVEAASGLTASNLYIVANQRNGDVIPYADGNNSNQYIEYYAETKNMTSVSGSYIAYNNTLKAFPNLATVFFNYYSVCKKADGQSIDNLVVQQSLTTVKSFTALQGVLLDNTNTKIYKENNSIALKVGNFSFMFSPLGSIAVKNGNNVLFSFSNGSGSGTVTYENVTVTQNIKTKKLYIDGIDIENKLVPLGMVHMWAGAVDMLPDNYLLCDGQAVNQSDYPELYQVIGSTFNTAVNCNGTNWVAPSSGMFRLPDLRGRFIVGYNSQNTEYSKIAANGGEATHTLKTSEMPSHAHSVNDYYGVDLTNSANEWKQKGILLGGYEALDGRYVGWPNVGSGRNAALYKTHDSNNTGGNDAHENRPPYYVLAYIMRVK